MKRIRRTLFLLIVLCTTLVLMPMTVFAAGMINNGIITGTGTWGIDVENTSSGVIVHGNYTKTVYNNGGLILGDAFQAIIDNGSGGYGLKMNIKNLTVNAALSEYDGEQYAIMPYNADFSFLLSPDSGFMLPDSITITQGNNTLVSGTDYTYDSSTGDVTINAGAVNAPLTIAALGTEGTQIWVNGENIVTAPGNTVPCGEGAAVYDSGSQILTFSNAAITQTSQQASGNARPYAVSILSPNADTLIRIVLQGDNSIIADAGIYTNCNLHISGNEADSLIIDASMKGEYAIRGENGSFADRRIHPREGFLRRKYSKEWKSDEDSHWHECSCGEKTDIAAHTSDSGKITIPATEGLSYAVCNWKPVRHHDLCQKTQ